MFILLYLVLSTLLLVTVNCLTLFATSPINLINHHLANAFKANILLMSNAWYCEGIEMKPEFSKCSATSTVMAGYRDKYICCFANYIIIVCCKDDLTQETMAIMSAHSSFFQIFFDSPWNLIFFLLKMSLFHTKFNSRHS